ncbi:unnamed protein product [Parnassius apollo]|uniref:(apollo) hypothetical protein n=1 Tax=Parnassius apollo TaxID=110799 RepID=A0A8S3WGN6_PARAO|nr:unnamed protein product [Parnassius apollo]
MYRFVILFALFSFAYSRQHCHDDPACKATRRLNNKNNNYYGRVFDKVSRSFITSDTEIQQACNVSTSNLVSQVFGLNNYVLKYKIPTFEEDELSIVIRHKVMYLRAQKENGLSFRDVRVLPDIVKTQDAKWFTENDALHISFPYKTPLQVETTTTCDINIIDYAIYVPKLTMDLNEPQSGNIKPT